MNDQEKPRMEDGVWYNLDPAASFQPKGSKVTYIFPRVLCEYQVPNNPNQYSVRGIPMGGVKEMPFILIFTKTGRVRVTRAEDQSSDTKS